jgi:hypothetical protein
MRSRDYCPAGGCPIERLVDRRAAAGGKPHSSPAVDRRVAAVNDEVSRAAQRSEADSA